MSNTIRTTAEVAADLAAYKASLDQGAAPDAIKLALLESEQRASAQFERYLREVELSKNTALLANVHEGDTISFAFGRGETRRVEQGRIDQIGEEKGKQVFVVLTGEGLDRQLVKVSAANVVFA